MLLQSTDRRTKARLDESSVDYLTTNRSIEQTYKPPAAPNSTKRNDVNHHDLAKFLSHFWSVILREPLLIVIFIAVLSLLFVLTLCWCMKRRKSKANHRRKIVKVTPTNLLEPNKVSTSALHTTATETQNDEMTMSLTNLPINNELIELKNNQKIDSKANQAKQKSKAKLGRGPSDRKMHIPSKVLADLQAELKSVYSCSSAAALDKRGMTDKGQVISQLSSGSEISPRATQRIKKFRESSRTRANRENKLRTPSSELRRKLHKSRRSRVITKAKKHKSREGFRHKFKDKSKDRPTNRGKSDSDPSESTERTDNRSTETKEKEDAKAVRSKKKARRKGAKSSLKSAPKNLSNRRQSGPREGKLHSIEIYGKRLNFKNKSNELFSIFKFIPDVDTTKLPNKDELYSPPSKSILKMGKRVVSRISLSRSSSEELVSQVKQFKGRTKDKIKTKSTEPMLDGEFH